MLPNKNADGIRLRPDGQPMTFVIEIANANTDQVDTGNMIAKYWKAVGIQVEAKSEDRSLMYERKNNNDLDAMIWGGEGGVNPILDPRNYFPNGNESGYAVAWAAWYTNPADPLAEEPPAEIKAMMDKFNEVKTATTWDKQVALMNELLQMSADFFPCMGISTPTPELWDRQEQHAQCSGCDDQLLELSNPGPHQHLYLLLQVAYNQFRSQEAWQA